MIIDIDSDNKDVDEMVLASKGKQWTVVNTVLNRKPYLINCVPEKRAWAALHQAVYWNDISEVSELLGYETCDALVKSKECRDDKIPPKSTAMVLARKNNCDKIIELLENNIKNHRAKRFRDEVLRFVRRAKGDEVRHLGFPLLALEVVMYKHALLSDHHIDVQTHSVSLMKKIYDNETVEWKHIEAELYRAVYGHCKESADHIRKAHAEDEEAFFKELIGLYTANHLYRDVNAALGREFHREYKPTGDELALGLYALLLNITLMFWGDLGRVRDTTYRGVGLNVTNHYVVGSEIMCTTLLSSSLLQSVGEDWRGRTGTLFIFNNSIESCKHSNHPRNISMYSRLEKEQECLYVLGTSFKVDEVDENKRIVKLSLL